jgi:hypothetical protein
MDCLGYRLLQAGMATELEKLVQAELIKGWEPLGRPFYVFTPGQHHPQAYQPAFSRWYQAITRKPEYAK